MRVLVRGCQLECSAVQCGRADVVHALVVVGLPPVKQACCDSFSLPPPVSVCSVVEDALGRPALQLAALNDNPHTAAARVAASARAITEAHSK